jgi:N-acetylglucosaminyldiphosphoundecaprenol N-acetyl-beta-D-mannosaminyltransferase
MSRVRPRLPVPGSWADPLTAAGLVRGIVGLVETGRGGLVANHNLHSLALLQRGELPAAWYERAAIAHIDGMPVVWLARAAGYRVQARHRTTYLDWLPALLDQAAVRRWSVCHVGGAPAQQPAIAAAVAARWPGIAFAGWHGYAAPGGAEDEAVARAVAQCRPQLVLCGMGMPRQERWLLRWHELFPGAAGLACGAAVQYLIGAQPTPPRWLGRCGLEWLHRLSADPRRLWHRYLVEPIALLPAAGAYLATGRRRLIRGDRLRPAR